MNNRRINKIIAIKGKRIASIDISKEAISSKIENTKFPKPTVTVDKKPLIKAVETCIKAGTKPPAITDILHFNIGGKPSTKEDIITIPEMIAIGVAIKSRALSIHGIKYAEISSKVATNKINNDV
ncbi:hypothetical protein PV797_18500 [Clostridiaceae bacterium M8S5]|nr:hypothetical protein PV797_18500 [Clostridiaceae bacterium M8S5]